MQNRQDNIREMVFVFEYMPYMGYIEYSWVT